MRIDPNQSGQAVSESSRPSTQTAGSSPAGSAPGEDQAQLSGAHVLVLALAAGASQLPDVREEKVGALRQAVQSGNYHPSPEQVAGALFSHLLTSRAA
ncbi:MAG TPA: flagellar biosynthesis anti-sigma factor FlgM [Terriglobales bacterium]|nr:flagellar biosynthesis anti-sigma factor FlgM [Terriglobales bacterium]